MRGRRPDLSRSGVLLLRGHVPLIALLALGPVPLEGAAALVLPAILLTAAGLHLPHYLRLLRPGAERPLAREEARP